MQHVWLRRYRIYHLYYPGTPFGISLWILIFGICQIFISLVGSCSPPAFAPRCHPSALIISMQAAAPPATAC